MQWTNTRLCLTKNLGIVCVSLLYLHVPSGGGGGGPQWKKASIGAVLRILVQHYFGKLDLDPLKNEKLDADRHSTLKAQYWTVESVDQWSQIRITLMKSRIRIRFKVVSRIRIRIIWKRYIRIFIGPQPCFGALSWFIIILDKIKKLHFRSCLRYVRYM